MAVLTQSHSSLQSLAHIAPISTKVDLSQSLVNTATIANSLPNGSASGSRRVPRWTEGEINRVIAISAEKGTVYAMKRALPGRSLTAIKQCRFRLSRAGVITIRTRRRSTFVRTAESDAEMAVAIVCGVTTRQLAARFGCGFMTVHWIKVDLGVTGPRDRKGAKNER
jgi:hypothetical protein